MKGSSTQASKRGRVATVRPVKRDTVRLVDEIHERLLEMISAGQLAPGVKLYQERLAEEFGVSRTPIREALLRLEREGLVESQPGRGMFVRGVGGSEIRELYEVREILEPFAARLSCARAGHRDVAAVEAIQRRHEGTYPRDVAVAFRSNLELHTGLARACGNQPLLRMLESIWHQDAALRIFAYYARDPQSVIGMVHEHRQIVDAFTAGDAATVEKLLRRHMQASYQVLVKRLEEMRREDRVG